MKGLEILTLRKEAGLKQYELAALLKISAPILCEMETGRRPTPRHVERKIQSVLKRVQSDGGEDAKNC